MLNVEDEVKKFHNDCKLLAKSIIKKEGSLNMTVLALHQKDSNSFTTVVIPAIGFLYDPEDKSLFLNAVKHAITLIKPVAIAFVSEAWMIKRDVNDGIDIDKRVSEYDDKQEIVMVQIETYKDTSLTIYEMIRNGKSIKLKLNEEQTQVGKDKVGGVFSDLLKDNYEMFQDELKERINNSIN